MKNLLYENIKRRRLELNMSQDTLAQLSGYSNRSAIARIENGEIDLPQSKIVAIAEALKTTPAMLMGWEVETVDITPEEHDVIIAMRNNEATKQRLIAYCEAFKDLMENKKV